MIIKILKKDYLKSEAVYIDFKEGNEVSDDNFLVNEAYEIDDYGDFPIYLSENDEGKREKLYLEGFTIINKIINELKRSEQLNGDFWYSYLLTKKRNFILQKYPEVLESEKNFRNIVLKKFDWENYIYKLILGTQYVSEHIKDDETKKEYYRLIANNLDLYNYIIKYEIFRNDVFLLKVLKILKNNKISEICKKKIPFFKKSNNKEGDMRYGRRVIFELNKVYPMVLSPMMPDDEFQKMFVDILNSYLELDNIEKIEFNEVVE